MQMPKKEPAKAQGEEVGYCFGAIPEVSNHVTDDDSNELQCEEKDCDHKEKCDEEGCNADWLVDTTFHPPEGGTKDLVFHLPKGRCKGLEGFHFFDCF